MKVFVSSVISGFEPYRAAARIAVETLRHEPVMAEDFGARPTSPQVACLDGVRRADLVVLILGGRYGMVQGGSGVSPTHEEFLEARRNKPVLVFVQQAVDREPAQAEFIDEIQAWQGGSHRQGFTSPDELKQGLIRALHDYTLANAVGPLDANALSEAATSLLPSRRQHPRVIDLAIVGGPIQRVLRPIEMEDAALGDRILKESLFGGVRLFDVARGVDLRLGETLIVSEKGGSRIQLDERGAQLLQLSVEEAHESVVLMGIIEETVLKQLSNGLTFANWVLETIDPPQRLTHVAVAARLAPDEFTTWRTRAQQSASPQSMSIPITKKDRPAIADAFPRALLRLEPSRIAEDFMVRLRRQWRPQ